MAVSQQVPSAFPAGHGVPGSRLAAGWELLIEAGDAVAALAQLAPDPAAIPARDFAMRAAAGGPARLALTEQMIDDCAATLHVGLTALLSATQAGRDPTAAALTLWREQDRARCALLALVTSVD